MDDYQMVPIGARLAELARLRLQYDESRRSVQVQSLSETNVQYFKINR